MIGGSVVLSVSVTGADPISYEWKHGGEIIPGGDEATLTLTNLSQSSAGEYQVVISNPAGSTLSEDADLTVLAPPEIESISENQYVVEGENVLLHVDAVGSSPLKYAWKRDGVLIDGQNGESLSLEEIVVLMRCIFGRNLKLSGDYDKQVWTWS